MKAPTKILLVEDDTTLAMIVADTLQREKFDVVTATDGVKGLECFKAFDIGLVIADVMMPLMDGFTMVREIRTLDARVPVLFLTAKSQIEDVVEGFDIGGNDYLRKPFKILELVARVKALLRTVVPRSAELCYIGRYIFNPQAQTLTLPQVGTVQLSHIEACLLRQLYDNINENVSSDSLERILWNRQNLWSRNSLHGFIHKLRHYLRHDPAVKILNQRGIGYKLVCVSTIVE